MSYALRTYIAIVGEINRGRIVIVSAYSVWNQNEDLIWLCKRMKLIESRTGNSDAAPLIFFRGQIANTFFEIITQSFVFIFPGMRKTGYSHALHQFLRQIQGQIEGFGIALPLWK